MISVLQSLRIQHKTEFVQCLVNTESIIWWNVSTNKNKKSGMVWLCYQSPKQRSLRHFFPIFITTGLHCQPRKRRRPLFSGLVSLRFLTIKLHEHYKAQTQGRVSREAGVNREMERGSKFSLCWLEGAWRMVRKAATTFPTDLVQRFSSATFLSYTGQIYLHHIKVTGERGGGGGFLY